MRKKKQVAILPYLVTEKSSIGGENPRRAKKYFVYVIVMKNETIDLFVRGN